MKNKINIKIRARARYFVYFIFLYIFLDKFLSRYSKTSGLKMPPALL